MYFTIIGKLPKGHFLIFVKNFIFSFFDFINMQLTLLPLGFCFCYFVVVSYLHLTETNGIVNETSYFLSLLVA